ncbi:uncharacterized protein LOC130635160 [Hydractinia symbiolongicarpus]|uniref:uncharacterized protein LOC130635160 n=1 Tax=Hydractinia symbiolongicarpus TaxID=13093 RepID=UPI00254BA58D|nr:uncharacterized protein LOC130635160 [Hydractinia symbiolongicarpus]
MHLTIKIFLQQEKEYALYDLNNIVPNRTTSYNEVDVLKVGEHYDILTLGEHHLFPCIILSLIQTSFERFCINSEPPSILGVDATFNICDYNVTITTYKHLLLVKSNTEEHPVMIGPTIIHSHKTFDSYYTLPSNIVRFKPNAVNLKSFGTDEETNIHRAFTITFQKADHLLCSIHVKDNIVKQAKKLGMKENEVLWDIFGKISGETKIKGLVDCETEEEFEEMYEKISEKWKVKPNGPKFIEYFENFKKNSMKEKMLSSVRIKCGLGNPPEPYTQNANESINSMIKRSKESGKLTLKQTVKLMQDEVKKQEEKVKLALIGKGDWKLAKGYQQFFIIESKFYNMIPTQKKAEIDKFNTFLPDAEKQDTPRKSDIIQKKKIN